MKWTLIRCAIAMGIFFYSVFSYAQDQAIIIRVQDQTQIGGIAGIVLLVNPGSVLDSKAFISDVNGQALIPHIDCYICTITAFDPRHLFYDKSIEFDNRSTSVTLILELRPGIDRFGIPDSILVNLTVYGSDGKPLPNLNIITRPKTVALGVVDDYNRIITGSTNSTGLFIVALVPGKYIVATLIDGNPLESEFEIYKSKIHCKPKAKNCWNPSFRPHPPTQNVEAHLSAVNPYSE